MNGPEGFQAVDRASFRQHGVLKSLGASFIWSGGTNYLTFLFSTIVRLVLARKLTPEMFGLYALASSLCDVFLLAAMFRFSVAIVQFPDDASVPSKVWKLIQWQAGLTVGFSVPLVTYGYFRGGWSLALMIGCYAMFQLTGYYRAYYQALLERDLDYRRCGVANAVPTILVGFGVLAWAWLLPSPLVLGVRDPVMALGALVLLWWWSPHARSAHCGVRETLGVLRIGGQVFLSTQAVNLYQRLDMLVVAGVASLACLGEYSQAKYLTLSLAGLLNLSLSPLFALYSNLGQYPDLRLALYRLVNRVLFRAMAFAVAFLLVFPEITVRALLGPGWEGAIPYLRLLAPTVAMTGIFSNMNTYLHASGKLSSVVVHLWVRVAYYGAILLATFKSGTMAIAAAHVICGGVLFFHLATSSKGLLSDLLRQGTASIAYLFLLLVAGGSARGALPFAGVLAVLGIVPLVLWDVRKIREAAELLDSGEQIQGCSKQAGVIPEE